MSVSRHGKIPGTLGIFGVSCLIMAKRNRRYLRQTLRHYRESASVVSPVISSPVSTPSPRAPEPPSDLDDVVQRDVAPSALDLTEIRPVQPNHLGSLLLTQPKLMTPSHHPKIVMDVM